MNVLIKIISILIYTIIQQANFHIIEPSFPGLSENQINCILNDYIGFMRLGTNDYLSLSYSYQLIKANKKNKPKTITSKNILKTNSKQLKFNENPFSIYFNGLSFISPEKMKYKYMLCGLDKCWKYTDADNKYASYSNIDPYMYTFKLMVANSSGIWNQKQDAMFIEIRPPFYLFKYSISLYFILIVLIIYFGWRKIKKRKCLPCKIIKYTKNTKHPLITLENFNDLKLLIADKNDALKKILLKNTDNKGTILNSYSANASFDLCVKELPDIVICNDILHEMSGYELCKKIKNTDSTCHIPTILISSKSKEKNQIHGHINGADYIISKPINIELLKAQIITAVDSRKKILNKMKENSEYFTCDQSISEKDQTFLEQASKFIDENLNNAKFSVADLEANLNVSRSTLNRKLKTLTGETASAFIRSHRIKKAASLLQNGDFNVTDAAYNVGIFDLDYFRNCFKKEFKMTPLK